MKMIILDVMGPAGIPGSDVLDVIAAVRDRNLAREQATEASIEARGKILLGADSWPVIDAINVILDKIDAACERELRESETSES